LPAIIYLGAEHGASKQEVLDLKWSDIIFSFQGKGLIRLFRTKNKMERSEYLMPRTRKALLEWREHQEWMREKKKIEDIGPGYVFCRLDGRGLNGFTSSWRKVRKIAGFERLHFHDLRHTYCSNLLLSGADLKDVKEMIGHRNLSMTDRYSHLTSMKKLSRQVELAKFYTNDNGAVEPSGEHIGNTEGKNGVFNKKRAD
jgi:integrase